MEKIGTYSLTVNTTLSFDETIEKVTSFLKEEGFGILTEVNVTNTFKNKLDIDFKPYRILGACNPKHAHSVLSAQPHAGVFLPCNVLVWDEGDHRVISAMNPQMMSNLTGNSTIGEVAVEVNRTMEKVLSRFEK